MRQDSLSMTHGACAPILGKGRVGVGADGSEIVGEMIKLGKFICKFVHFRAF